MITELTSILNKINKTSTKLNILTFATHESYQTLLDQTGHNFYIVLVEGGKQWDFITKPLPKNHIILNQYWPNLPTDIEFDLVLAQDIFGGLQRALEVGQRFGIPVINLSHALPPYDASNKEKQQLIQLSKLATKRVFVGHVAKEIWGGLDDDPVINYGMDSNIWKGWRGTGKHGLSVVNLFPQRDLFCGWNLWSSVAKERQIKLIGNNPGLSPSISDTDQLISEYNQARYFLNTSQYSTFPMTVAEAMLCGCPVISTNKYECGRVIQHEKNGLIANTKEEIINCIDKLQSDYDFAKQIGEEGRKTAMELFNVDKFITAWNRIFNEVYAGSR